MKSKTNSIVNEMNKEFWGNDKEFKNKEFWGNNKEFKNKEFKNKEFWRNNKEFKKFDCYFEFSTLETETYNY